MVTVLRGDMRFSTVRCITEVMRMIGAGSGGGHGIERGGIAKMCMHLERDVLAD